tara:strand:- start:249 stop:644 length:396 start_codon:yes stop_codon:yes gene_type:complete
MKPHLFNIRVYYEDTDFTGIVFYANYFKFIERARSDWVRSLNLDQGRLKSDKGLFFVVRHLEADFLAPAHFDDELLVTTELERVTRVRIVLLQSIFRDKKCLFSSLVTLVTLGGSGHPTRLPAEFRLNLGE